MVDYESQTEADSLCFGKRGWAKGGCGLHCVVYVAGWWRVPLAQTRKLCRNDSAAWDDKQNQTFALTRRGEADPIFRLDKGFRLCTPASAAQSWEPQLRRSAAAGRRLCAVHNYGVLGRASSHASNPRAVKACVAFTAESRGGGGYRQEHRRLGWAADDDDDDDDDGRLWTLLLTGPSWQVSRRLTVFSSLLA